MAFKPSKVKYLEEIPLTDDGGVVKKVIRYGEGEGEDSIPLPGQEIVIVYDCRLTKTGVQVDSWKEHIGNAKVKQTKHGIQIVAGMGNLIEGWDMGLLTMRLGEAADIFIKSKYAFGEEGRPPKIPGNSDVIFNVELVQVGQRLSKKYGLSSLPPDELLKKAKDAKASGNEKFKAKEFELAARRYREGLELISAMTPLKDQPEGDGPEIYEIDDKEEQREQEKQELTIQLHQNLAMTLNNVSSQEALEEALFNCEQAIGINESKATKAFYLKSQILKKQNELEKGIAALKRCIQLQPNDRKLRQDLEVMSKELGEQNMSFGQKIGNFISKGIYNEKKSTVKKVKPKIIHKKLPDFDPSNVQCFLEFTVGYANEPENTKIRGRVVFELFDKDLPITVENFRILCLGEKSQQHFYQGTWIHRIVPGYCIEGGDTSAVKDGKGGKSIYGPGDEPHSKDNLFEDENVWYPHTHAGTISMLHDGPNTNGSRFLITMRDRIEYFDERNTLFGRIIDGFEILDIIQKLPRTEEKPQRPVFVTKCGELRFGDKLTADQCDFLHEYERNVFFEDEQREKRRQEKRAKRLQREKEEAEKQAAEEAEKKALEAPEEQEKAKAAEEQTTQAAAEESKDNNGEQNGECKHEEAATGGKLHI